MRKVDLTEMMWEVLDFMRLAQDRNYWHSNEPAGCIETREFLNWLSDYQLLKDSAPWSKEA
jgi:hypothetical protein